jgi:hypothetical protein
MALPLDWKKVNHAYATYVACGKQQSETARRLGIPRTTLIHYIKVYEEANPIIKTLVGGTPSVRSAVTREVPATGVRRYILTCAQNNTAVFEPAWQALQALAGYYDAEIHVSRFAYNKASYGEMSTKPGTAPSADEYEGLWYDPRLVPFFSDASIRLAPGLIWCGEMNILPTAEAPLSGLEAYTGRESGIFPHVKLEIASVASARNEATKLNYTTGTVTQRNYIQKKAGLKSEPYHSYGGLLVEVLPCGSWFVRQLTCYEDGVMFDLNAKVVGQKVERGTHVEGITWGDVHVDELDPVVNLVCWGEGGMIDVLRPRFQFYHDLVDFGRRNHWEDKDCHRRFERHIRKLESVSAEYEAVAAFLRHSWRPFTQDIVVESNHNQRISRWLKEADYRQDPVNARFFLQAQDAKYASIEDGTSIHMTEWALARAGAPDNILYLREDENFVLCREVGGGIDCGQHGDNGPNGARGGVTNFARLGRRMNIGHMHIAAAHKGVWVAGTCSILDPDYVTGPSAWSHSQILTYPNAARQMITLWKGKWRG